MTSPKPISLEFREHDGRVSLFVAGRLDLQTVREAWDRISRTPPVSRAQELTVDVSGVTYCDGAGLGLFAELRRRVALAGGQVELVGASPELRRLLDLSMLTDPLAEKLHAPPRPGLTVEVGKATWHVVQDAGRIIVFTGELTAALGWALVHPRQVRWRDVLLVAQKVGADAVPVVSLLGLLVGSIIAYQCAPAFRKFGSEAMVPIVVAVAAVRELGPMLTAILLAGRSGSAFAAEIGTMKVTEELAALKTMALEPVRFLVLPRVLATVMVTPLLSVFNTLLALVGGYLVMATLGYTLRSYIHTVTEAINYVDLLGGLFKTLVFALIVAAVGCLRGTQTRSGPGAVGDSTTRAVVAGIVLTIAADGVLGVVYYYLRI